MQRSEIVTMVANAHAAELRKATKGGLAPWETRKLVNLVVDAFLDTVALTVSCDEPVALYGFGRFELHTLKACERPHPVTGETMHIPERSTVGFAPAKPLKERVNR